MTRRRISDEEAWADAKRAGYTPKNPHHPGTTNRWLGTCDTCGQFVAPFYGNIRQGHKACRVCAKTPRSAVPRKRSRLTLEDAAAHFRAARLTPLDAYPGRASEKWRSSCDVCGAVVTPRVSSVVHSGSGCRWCGRAKATITRALNKNKP